MKTFIYPKIIYWQTNTLKLAKILRRLNIQYHNCRALLQGLRNVLFDKHRELIVTVARNLGDVHRRRITLLNLHQRMTS